MIHIEQNLLLVLPACINLFTLHYRIGTVMNTLTMVSALM